jgi:hypothetical protein
MITVETSSPTSPAQLARVKLVIIDHRLGSPDDSDIIFSSEPRYDNDSEDEWIQVSSRHCSKIDLQDGKAANDGKVSICKG